MDTNPQEGPSLAPYAKATGGACGCVRNIASGVERRAAWIHADQAKARKAITVPLNDMAVDVLKRQMGKHPHFVFTYKTRPIGQVHTKAWTNALKRAEIEDFRWHDLRHTWASWLTRNGVPLNALQEMGACQSAEMVRRYAHLASEQFIRHARVVDQLMNADTIAAQAGKGLKANST